MAYSNHMDEFSICLECGSCVWYTKLHDEVCPKKPVDQGKPGCPICGKVLTRHYVDGQLVRALCPEHDQVYIATAPAKRCPACNNVVTYTFHNEPTKVICPVHGQIFVENKPQKSDNIVHKGCGKNVEYRWYNLKAKRTYCPTHGWLEDGEAVFKSQKSTSEVLKEVLGKLCNLRGSYIDFSYETQCTTYERERLMAKAAGVSAAMVVVEEALKNA
jgi:uncharacterized Zn finger protein (UPF0148 family)